MNKATIASVALVASLVFMILSYCVPKESPLVSGWTEERSKKHAEVGIKLHQMSYGGHNHDHGPPAPGAKPDDGKADKAALDAQWKLFNEGQAELEQARNRGEWLGNALVGVSVLSFCVGAVFVILWKAEEEAGK